jgi:hypothetical protein
LTGLLMLVPATASAQVGPTSFGPVAFYGSGNFNTISVAAGDLNNDGFPDLVAVSQCYSSNPLDCHTGISVLINNGDGTFKPATTYKGDGTNGFRVAIADVNGDGILDLVILNSNNPTTISVMVGAGDGTFGAPVSYLLPTSSTYVPAAMAVADVNGDGKPDVVVALGNLSGGSAVLTVLLNQGGGTFGSAVIYNSGGLFGTQDVIVADVNGDGVPDLVDVNLCSTPTQFPNGTANPCVGSNGTEQPGTIGVLIGNGNGTFQPAAVYFSGGYMVTPGTGVSQTLAAVDLNHDGKLDLLVSNQCCQSYGMATVLLGNGDGSFQAPVTYSAGTTSNATWITAADVDGDGNPDAVVVSSTDPFGNRTPTVSVMLGNGDGTLQTPHCVSGTCSGLYNFFPYLTPANMVVMTDLNRDGKPDLIAAIGCGNAASCAQGAAVRVNQTPRAQTTTSLASAPNPSSYGQSVALTATVTSAAPGTPTGSVTFTGATTLGSAPLVGNTATLNVSTLLAGNHAIVASYSSDSAFRASTSAPLAQTVNLGGTATTVTSSANPSAFLQSVTFTATVTAAFGGGLTGSVTFKDGATVLGNGAMTGVTATFSTSTLAEGAHAITAIYSGDANSHGSTSAALNQSVGKASSMTSVASSLTPSFVTQAVTFTATVTGTFGGTPTGNVTFKNGATVLGTVALSGGTATYTTSALAAGSYTILAAYVGDIKFKPSSGNTKQVVNKYPTTTVVGSSLTPSKIGQLVTFTATVSSTHGVIPDGETVTFKNGATVLGTGTTSAGQATFSSASLAAGSFTITAVYAGDATFATSSGTVKQTVNKYSTTTVLTSSPNPSTVGSSVTFTATVSSTGGAIPDGETVTFKNGATVLGTGLTGAGQATFSSSSLAAGSLTIMAVYVGDATFVTSSGTVKQTVNKYTTTTVLTSSPNPSTLGSSVTFTATVSSTSGAIPDGETVTFKNGATVLGTGLTSGGTVAIAVSTLPHGSDPVTATYAGDPTFGASNGSIVQHVN